MVIIMKHDVTTYQTKRLMADALKKEMEKKSLSKITITDIVTSCKLNRKTFYYHFVDIYDLVKWMLEEETLSILKSYDLMNDYHEAVEYILEKISSNKYIFTCAVDSMGYELLKHLFKKDFSDILYLIITKTEEELDLHTSEDYKHFLCHLYVNSLIGFLIDEAKGLNKYTKEQLLRYVSSLRQALPEVLKKAPQI